MSFEFRSETDDTEPSDDESHLRIQLESEAVIQIKKLENDEKVIKDLINVLKNYLNLSNTDLSENSLDTAKKFLIDEGVKSLCVYSKNEEQGLVTTSLDLPPEELQQSFDQLVYFLKKSSFHDPVTITKDSLSEKISFGNVDCNFRMSLLLLFDMIYVPAFYGFNNLPRGVKYPLIKAVQDFIIYINEIEHLKLGLSRLYLPAITNITNEDLDEDLLLLLEDIVKSWCRQIRTALIDTEINFQMIHMTDLISELNFWSYRCDNLKFLLLQLKHPYATKICCALRKTSSAFIEQLDTLIEDLQSALDCAILNAKCLHTLQDLCSSLNSSRLSPEIIIPIISNILFRISVICEISPHYKSWYETEHLISCLSNQIIKVGSKSIDIPAIISYDIFGVGEQLDSILQICKLYKIIYEMVANFHNNKSNVKWDQNSNRIFGQVEVFVHHCKNVQFICDLINIFKRCEESKTGELAICANQYLNFQNKLDEINVSFRSSLKEYGLPLLSQNFELYAMHEKFCDKLEVLQKNLKELFEDSFKFVNDVDGGLEVLRVIYQYKKLPLINTCFHQNTTQIYDIFMGEINIAYEETMSDISLINFNQESNDMKRIVKLFARKRRLQYTYKLVADCRGWLPKCGIIDNFEYNYDLIIKILSDLIIKAYADWQLNINSEMRNKLKRPLIQKYSFLPDLYEINVDRNLIKFYRDAKIWMQLGFVLSPQARLVIKDVEPIIGIYRGVESLVMDYNRIIASLSNEEHSLFSEIVKTCKNAIQPLLTKLQWNNESCIELVTESHNHIKYCENKIKFYKRSSVKIIQICEDIRNVNFIDDADKIYEFEDLKRNMEINRYKILKLIIDKYNNICSLLCSIHKEFSNYLGPSKTMWILYVEKIDSLFEDALKIFVENCLKKFFNLISLKENCCDQKFYISISIQIANNKIQFVPTLSELASFVMNLYPNILMTLNKIPRIFNNFNFGHIENKSTFAKCISMHPDIIAVQKEIFKALNIAMTSLKVYVQENWNMYRIIWKIQPEIYAIEYLKLEPDPENIKRDIIMYKKILKEVKVLECKRRINCFTVDVECLIIAVTNRCENLINILLKISEARNYKLLTKKEKPSKIGISRITK